MLAALLCCANLFAASKPHVIAFGKWQAVKWYVDSEEETSLNVKIRGLYVDSKLKEYTAGLPHDVTDRIFVVRRAYRMNDSLPGEDNKAPRWKWQLGGWLQIDRLTGRISALNLPEFDPLYSQAAWYRDYIAYCGVSDDGEKLSAVVIQLGRRKAVLKKALGEAEEGDSPDSNCTVPEWQRQPARVTFLPKGKAKVSYEVRGHSADLVTEEAGEE